MIGAPARETCAGLRLLQPAESTGDIGAHGRIHIGTADALFIPCEVKHAMVGDAKQSDGAADVRGGRGDRIVRSGFAQ